MRYCVVTLGCQMNVSDSERIERILGEIGYERTDREEDADLLGIVACSVRQKAIDKLYSRIHKWTLWKTERPLITFATGCILPADKKKLLKRFDLIFPIAQVAELPVMLSQYGVVTGWNRRVPQTEGTSFSRPAQGISILKSTEGKMTPAVRRASSEQTEFWGIKPQYSSSFEAYVPIQNGCDKFCTFCAVPYTRGREISRKSDDILREVEDLLNKGYKSITLLGQNVNSYGLDKKKNGISELNFAGLLREIGEMGRAKKDKVRVYFTSPHPRDMTRDVIETVGIYPSLAKKIHLPLQSGDDKLLFKMNRNHKVSQYRDIVGMVREIIPEATLFTDIIVGFCGETEKQFQNTLSAMREFQYNMAYIAQYSPRPGAASDRWEDNVPQEIKKERFRILTRELQRGSREYNEKLIGKKLELLVDGEGRKGDYLWGKTEGHLLVRFAGKDKSLLGQFVDVIITEADDLTLEGRLINNMGEIAV